MIYLFHKPDDDRKPYVLIQGDKELARKKLVRLLHGKNYEGTWEQTEIPKDEFPKLKMKLNVIYEPFTEKILLSQEEIKSDNLIHLAKA